MGKKSNSTKKKLTRYTTTGLQGTQWATLLSGMYVTRPLNTASNVGSIVSVYFGLIRETFLFNFKLNFYHSSCLDLFSLVPHENWCLSFQYRRLKLTISFPTHSAGHSCVLHGISSSGFSSPPFSQTLSATADLSSFLMHFTLRVFFPVKERDRHDWLETTL